jgi:hypothetical protein
MFRQPNISAPQPRPRLRKPERKIRGTLLLRHARFVLFSMAHNTESAARCPKAGSPLRLKKTALARLTRYADESSERCPPCHLRGQSRALFLRGAVIARAVYSPSICGRSDGRYSNRATASPPQLAARRERDWLFSLAQGFDRDHLDFGHKPFRNCDRLHRW